MKTPEQIADEQLSRFGYSVHDPSRALAAAVITAAIQADRAQRDPNEDGTLHGAAIIALKERSYHAGDTEEGWRASDAAGWIEANPDEFWDSYAGPMLDEIEQECGR